MLDISQYFFSKYVGETTNNELLIFVVSPTKLNNY